jgi:hypothetical protein
MVDFEKNNALRAWIVESTGGPAAGGLTVRDVMAITAMGVYLEAAMGQMVDMRNVAENAYMMADAMLDARIKLPPQEQCSVEEAFGLEK